MVASEGGISYETALKMTRRLGKDMLFALGIVHGADIDWDEGIIRPPKVVQDAAQKAAADIVGSGSLSFSI